MLRVLLVDDEPFILQGLEIMIDWESEGYRVVKLAGNGREAIEYLSENQVDLIITDIRMPEMSGIELLENIRKDGISDAYVIILSGYSDFEYAKKAMHFSCMDYILKPIRKEELNDMLRKISECHEKDQTQSKERERKEKAFLSRNAISIIHGKYDLENIKYVRENLKLSFGIRYISIELDADASGVQTPPSDERRRELQRTLYRNGVDYLGEIYGRHCIFDVSNHEQSYDIGLIYCKNMADEAGFSESAYMNRLLQALKQDIDVPVIIFAGESVSDLSELNRSYHTTERMSGFRTFQSGSSIYYFEEFEMGGTSGTVICKDVLDDVITEIEHNNIPMIEQKLDLLYNELQAFASDVKRVNLNINYLMFQLIHIASEISKDVDQDEILQKINKNAFTDGTIRGSRMHLKRFATEYAEYLVQLRENLSGGILPQIEKEIREHYMDNLTLKELSKKYFINNVYLGQIFKKKYEISFKDYLNNVRVEKAAHLLLCTDKKVYEIADDVGYGNLDYFINRFIALKGCTPARFRKQER